MGNFSKFATRIIQRMENYLPMPRKNQVERFKETAREIEADTSDDALDRVFGKLDLARKPATDEQKDKPKAR